MASPTTVIGVVGAVGVMALEWFFTGQISPDRIAEAMTLAGMGYFAADGKVFTPIIANVLNGLLLRAAKNDEVPHVIPSPTKLPDDPELGATKAKKTRAKNSKLKVVKNVK